MRLDSTSHKPGEHAIVALSDLQRVEILIEQAYTFRDLDDFEAAIGCCQEAIKIKPDSTTAHALLGQMYQAKGDSESSLREFDTVVEQNPGSIADGIATSCSRARPPGSLRITLMVSPGRFA